MRKINQAEIMERFMTNVYPEPNTGCWLWGGGNQTVDGYGVLKLASIPLKTKTTHRISWFLHNGPFDTSLHVLHKCDVPACVNPDHLFLGTHQDNIKDRTIKGRTANNGKRGEEAPTSLLTESDVLEIRSLHGKRSQKEIGNLFGVAQTTIHAILNRITWKHI